MKFRRRFRRSVVIGLAASAFIAPAAQARLIDPPLGHHADGAGSTVHKSRFASKDLRSADARDAARLSEEQALASRGQGAPAQQPVPVVQSADGGIDWGSIGLGAAGFLAAAAAFALANVAVTRRGRIHPVR